MLKWRIDKFWKNTNNYHITRSVDAVFGRHVPRPAGQPLVTGAAFWFPNWEEAVMKRTDDVSLWPWSWRSPRLSVIRVLVLCRSKFCIMAHTGQTYHVTVTLTFNPGGHGAFPWCGSTSSIRTRSLKLGLTVRKIWHILCVCVSRPVTLSFDLLTLKLVCNVSTCHGVASCQFWWYHDYSFSIYGPLGQYSSDWSRDPATLTLTLEVMAPFLLLGVNHFNVQTSISLRL